MEYDPVPMTSTLRALLLEQRKEGWNKEYVFCHCNGDPWQSKIPRQRLNIFACAIQYLTATLLAKEGPLPMKDIQNVFAPQEACYNGELYSTDDAA